MHNISASRNQHQQNLAGSFVCALPRRKLITVDRQQKYRWALTTQASSLGWAGAWHTLGIDSTQESLQRLQRLKLVEQPGRKGRQLIRGDFSGRGRTTGQRQRQPTSVERGPTKTFARQLIWRVGPCKKERAGDGNREKPFD